MHKRLTMSRKPFTMIVARIVDLENNEGFGDFQVFMQRRFGVVYSECISSWVKPILT